MRRAIARAQTWWLWLFILAIPGSVVLGVPFPFDIALMAVPLLLCFVRPPSSALAPVELSPPVKGRWVVLNSPGSSVPSHGTRAHGQAFAVDLLPRSLDTSTPLRWFGRGRTPESYPCFGAPVLAMASGTVIRAHSTRRDHRARSTVSSILWMMTAEGLLRELMGTSGMLGNHVILRHDNGLFSAYAHLRKGSTTVGVGAHVAAGQQLGELGNTGNSSEPHLHVQLMDRPHPSAAAGVPMHWPRAITDPSDRDPRWTSEPKPTAQQGFPANGQVFDVA